MLGQFELLVDGTLQQTVVFLGERESMRGIADGDTGG
jgi:hypothetical protein